VFVWHGKLISIQIIYLPVSATPALQSFAVPILNVTDSRVTAPWFGANKWEGVIQPVHGGGIPPQYSELEMVMEFKEGGAFDFATTFERLKERLKQAVEVARDSEGVDLGDARGAGALNGVNLNSVHLDELPAYEESGQHIVVPVGPLDAIPAPRPMGRDSVVASSPEPCVQSSPLASPQRQSFSPPSEPPPGYEEVQRGSIVDELERRLREPEHGDER
jgi:hypothetical protein